MAETGFESMIALAKRQHGIVNLAQLHSAGIGHRRIEGRVARGQLIRVHHGVYRVGLQRTRRSDFMAGVMACGPDTFLSHRSAAELWELLPEETRGAAVEVTLAGRDAARRRPGLRVCRRVRMAEKDRTRRFGIPVTTPERTVLDLAWVSTRSGRVSEREVEQALARAERSGLVDLEDLRHRVRVRPRKATPPGTPLVRALLDRTGGPAFTRSEAEERFLGLVRSSGLPEPETNVRVGPFEVDFLWPAFRLGVEVDGFLYHRSRRQFERDRRRDAELAARGIQMLRVTWRQLEGEAEQVIALIARAIGVVSARTLSD